MSKYTKTCLVCNKEFHLKHLSAYKKRKYCGFSCARKAQAHERRKHKKPLIKKCPVCGDEYELRSPSDYKRSKFCSTACYGKSMEIKIDVECDNCGKLFSRPPARISSQVFGSIECRDEHWQGENNPNWKDEKVPRARGDNWWTQRRKTLKRDGRICQICGYHQKMKKPFRYIDVHHIIPYKDFDGDYKAANKLSNLITLCRSCHSDVENGRIACPRMLL